MKINRFSMESWLIDSKKVDYNLAESGCQDLILSEFLHLCSIDTDQLRNIFLGDNIPWGSATLRKEICNSYQTICPENLMVANGTSEALFAFFNTMLESGDEVIVPFPAFQSLYQIPLSIGCNVKFLRLEEQNHWKIDFEKFERLVTPRTKLIIINTPHNPFGWTLSENEMERIMLIAKKNCAHLLFDEHYRYLPLTNETMILPSGYDVCHPHYAKVYATGSMIKCFGIVGIRIGWLIGDTNTLQRCIEYKDYLTHTIPCITDFLAYISLKNKEVLISHHKKNILPNIERFNDFVESNSKFLEFLRPMGGVVCFPKLKGICATHFCKQTLQKFGVSLLPGDTFDVDNHFRINFGIEQSRFDRALKLIQQSFSETSWTNFSTVRH